MLFSSQWPTGLIVFCILVLGACTSPPSQNPHAPTAPKPHKSPILNSSRYNVAFLIMNGTFNTELTAPFDIFHHTRFREGIKAMNVFLVANTLEPITTFEGLQLLPNFDYLENVYFVHDGKFITSAGGARSFEAALYLCELLYGKKVVEQLAHGLVINWDLKSVPYKVY